MNPDSKELYGYRIGDSLLYPLSSVLIPLEVNRLPGGKGRAPIKLRKTMALLLEYLLSNAADDFISDAELIENVWEKNGLRGSSARLWQVINSLRIKLHDAGCEKDIILRVNCSGYMLRHGSISPLFFSDDMHNPCCDNNEGFACDNIECCG